MYMSAFCSDQPTHVYVTLTAVAELANQLVALETCCRPYGMLLLVRFTVARYQMRRACQPLGQLGHACCSL